MNSSISRLVAIGLATIVAAVGWIALGRLELGASETLVATNDALMSVEQSLRGSTDVAEATADALDAAADSLDAASLTTESTAAVATDVADVAGTLSPVVVGVADGLEQLDSTVAQIDRAFDGLPFDLGFDVDQLRLDPVLRDVDPLVAELAVAEASLDALADDAESLSPESRQLAGELRRVAAELRASTGNIDELADGVQETQQEVDSILSDESVDLRLAQVLLLALCLAIIATNVGRRETVPAVTVSHAEVVT